jgi:glycosyltransferase involved in cell wall biosynthesis
MSEANPTVSIITVVRNCADHIGKCIQSLYNQNYPVEHIIIDGCSTDDTMNIIRANATATAKIVSEPDRGIYHAMNKGLALATGDLVGTLNADDFYAHDKVLCKVAEKFADPTIQSCYGDLICVDPVDLSRVVRYWKAGAFHSRRFYWGWMPPHPTFFVRRSVYEQFGGFRLDLGSAADYELVLRFLLKHKVSALYIPEPLVIMRTGGVSNATWINRIRANRQCKEAWKVNDMRPMPWTLIAMPLSKIGQFFFTRVTTKRPTELSMR